MPYQTTVLGIDASARSTGVVRLRPDMPSIEQIIKPKNLKEGERLAFIERATLDLLKDQVVDLAVMEGPSYRSTNKPFTLGEVYGTFKLILFRKNIKTLIAPPRAVKKYAVGKGTATKEQMIQAAYKQGCSTAQEDVADAWHLAMLGRDVLAGQAGSGKRSAEEVVQKMRRDLCLC